MNKIIGFLISKSKLKFNPDIFNVGLTTYNFRHSDFFISIWGIGDIKNEIIDNTISLAFFRSDNLLDRNVLIRLKESKIEIENDWLGSIPVFYNLDANVISTLPNLCMSTKEICLDSLSNFFDFGYSVFEQTPFKSLKFLRFFSKIIFDEKIIIKRKKDPVLNKNFIKQANTGENEVIDLIKKYISKIEKYSKGDIIVPTSAGYDSRLINYLINNKKRIKSFTYGVDKNQKKSHEVVFAKKLSDILNINWEQISLEHFNTYIDDWFKIYGISTHLHGMYQIEFYKKVISKLNNKNSILISGIVGDLWAGSMSFVNLNSHIDVTKLSLNHGLCFNRSSIFESNDLIDAFLKENNSLIKDKKLQIITVVRLKMILLSYLTQIPEYLGIPVGTPFLNYEIVKAHLKIDENKRVGRVWQKEYFQRVGLNLEQMNLNSNLSNHLDVQIGFKSKFEKLDEALLKNYVSLSKVKKINKVLIGKPFHLYFLNTLLNIPKVATFLRILGVKNLFLEVLAEYYVLKSFEKSLKYVN